MRDNYTRLNTFIGIATVGSTIVGAAGLLAAIASAAAGEWTAVGVCLAAAALAFGLLANAVLR